MVAVIILLVLLILGELFTLMLQCRRGHSAWGLLRLFRYAHRGYHDKPRIPENSMAAFRRAIENGFGAELDVHLMKDGRLAVIHDASLKRTAGADVLVEDLTAEELKTYRLEGTDEQIPLLEEVLELFQDLTPLIIELKAERGNHAALAEATCRMLDRYRVHYCIESFDPRCLIWLKKTARRSSGASCPSSSCATGRPPVTARPPCGCWEICSPILPPSPTSSPTGSPTGTTCVCAGAGNSTTSRRSTGPSERKRRWKPPRPRGTW